MPVLNSTAVRFIANGLLATVVHFTCLVILMEIVEVGSAGLANGLAAIVGITVSYLGNRNHVIRSRRPHADTLPRFLALYGLVALLHAAVLAVWTDLLRLDYGAGFLLATAGSLALTYVGNKLVVFRQSNATR